MAEPNDMSRFNNTPLTTVNGVETFSMWSMPRFLSDDIDDSYISKYHVTNAVEGRPDLISYELYGTPHLDWVLIAFNHARNVLNWPKAGTVIDYPVGSVVYSQLA